MNNKYKSNLTYPNIENLKPNEAYGLILLNDYAALVSEDTAIHQYLYQALILEGTKYATILKGIAEVEMHHLELLGETIKRLGVDPKYRIIDSSNHHDLFFDASYVNYSKDIKAILKVDIESENQAIMNYQYQYQIIMDEQIRSLLKRIIDDELIHLDIFMSLYNELMNA